MPLAQYFRLVDIQARMLLKADASKFTLGYLWWFIEPMLWVAMFYVVFNVILDSPRSGPDFLVFLATGKLAFIWFSKTVSQASNSIVASHGLIARINVPKSLFPMSAVQESCYKQITIYVLLAVILWFFGYTPTSKWLWMAPVALVFYLMIVACSLIGAFLVCMLRDFAKVIPLGMTFLLFSSGIFWDVREIGDPEKIDIVLTINPMAFMLDAHRQVLMYGNAPDLSHLLQIALGSVFLIVVMIGLMRRYSQLLALKVLT